MRRQRPPAIGRAVDVKQVGHADRVRKALARAATDSYFLGGVLLPISGSEEAGQARTASGTKA
jgi:hypothetical protein